MFETMKELMVNLSLLNWENTKYTFEERMGAIMDDTDFSFDNLNSVCWAAGAISGSLNDNDEKNFFIYFLRKLLKLVELKKGKEAKATIASNIMYMVG